MDKLRKLKDQETYMELWGRVSSSLTVDYRLVVC